MARWKCDILANEGTSQNQNSKSEGQVQVTVTTNNEKMENIDRKKEEKMENIDRKKEDGEPDSKNLQVGFVPHIAEAFVGNLGKTWRLET